MVSSVRAVHSSPTHDFSKEPMPSITLIEGIGVSGDAHAGTTIQHRSRVARDPSTPNLRQVHLIHGELFDHLRDEGFTVEPGSLGENITTRGVDLLELPVGTRLSIGEATVVVTGLRNPCRQIDDLQPGLMKRLVFKDDDGHVRRLAGIMGIVARGGVVRPGDQIIVDLPPPPHYPLTTV
jgi:MOSC domain-containing protein YiiM